MLNIHDFEANWKSVTIKVFGVHPPRFRGHQRNSCASIRFRRRSSINGNPTVTWIYRRHKISRRVDDRRFDGRLAGLKGRVEAPEHEHIQQNHQEEESRPPNLFKLKRKVLSNFLWREELCLASVNDRYSYHRNIVCIRRHFINDFPSQEWQSSTASVVVMLQLL